MGSYDYPNGMGSNLPWGIPMGHSEYPMGSWDMPWDIL